MTRPAEPSRVVLWVVLGIVGLFIIGIGGCAIWFFTSSDFKKIIGQAQQMESKSEVAELLRGALEKHVGPTNNWPNNLLELSRELAPETLRAAAEGYEYKKPAPNDPPETIVVWTKPSADRSSFFDYRIEIDKSFRGYVVTRTPLDQRSGPRVSSD